MPRTGEVIAMTWTLMMLMIAFGLSVSAFIGWRRERRDQHAGGSEPAKTTESDGTSRHVAEFADFAHAGHA
ncbi:hypothetical protein DWF00_03130 [Bosea caraganae]|uniref:Uncharacterized protein n=1 Tax=Bosea caraganae TaxID=2763117 RepID=A0A370L582_9HYPH|nr:hypothetical protein [Bosea caraganae]RDJ24099.1 hypothetical protein DWE98_14360 [Bosea caraganae]RDJ30141.1 hypothetical protein DWF00_03130 [Bosea caraganae]